LWRCILVLTVVSLSTCGRPAVVPAPVRIEQRVAGCYALQAGVWQINPEFGVHSVAELPPQIQLSSVRAAWSSSSQVDSLPFFIARSLPSQGRAAYLFSYWQRSSTNSDTIRVSGDSPPFSIVDLRLRHQDADLSGEIHIRRHFPSRTEHPLVATARVVGQWVPCPSS
jgi:hypothetical protein